MSSDYNLITYLISNKELAQPLAIRCPVILNLEEASNRELGV